jgi:hypothetical protein
MANTKGGRDSSTASLTALKIGSRVRCSDDGVQGRITWANAIAVKIQWDDGEQVTWRRDALTERPIDILEAVTGEEQAEANAQPADKGQGVAAPELAGQGQGVAAALPRAEPPADATAIEAGAAGSDQPASTETTARPEQPAPQAAVSSVEPAAAEPASSDAQTAQGEKVAAAPQTTAETPAPSKQRPKAPATAKEKKLSALDAAATVLAETATAMTCQEMIVAMAQKGYWTSPGGQTPAATLDTAVTMLPKAC